MNNTIMSKEEIRSYLKHCSVPTLIVEGKDDMSLIRPIEREINNLDVINASGKDAVLYLHEHRAEYSCRTAYLVDRDFWIFDGIPAEFTVCNEVIITHGYSLENDLIIDTSPDNLLFGEEVNKFQSLITLLVKWSSACATHRKVNGRFWQIKISKIFDFGINNFSNELIPFLITFPGEDCHFVKASKDPKRHIRGKTLMELLNYFFSSPARPVNFDIRSVMAASWSSNSPLSADLKSKIAANFV